MRRKPIVIIGSGLAGYAVIREFRKFDVEAPVLILSADHGDLLRLSISVLLR